jgi:transposase-like protein
VIELSSQKPLNLYDFLQQFSDEEACRQYLFKVRWPNGFICPRCGKTEYYYLGKYARYQCVNCDYQVSLTAGTIMHKTHLPLSKWFIAIYLVSTDKRGCSASTIQLHIHVNYKTAWLMLHKIRHAMGKRDEDYLLSGIVQLDETFFGGPNGKQGRGTYKSPAFVGVSTEITQDGEIIPMFGKIQITSKTNNETARQFMADFIEKSSTVVTDCFSIYNTFPEEYEHIKFKSDSPEGQKALEWLHVFISNTKAFIQGTYHGLSDRHLQVYMDEYCYRFNRRHYIKELFPRLLNACVNTKTITMAELIG